MASVWFLQAPIGQRIRNSSAPWRSRYKTRRSSNFLIKRCTSFLWNRFKVDCANLPAEESEKQEAKLSSPSMSWVFIRLNMQQQQCSAAQEKCDPRSRSWLHPATALVTFAAAQGGIVLPTQHNRRFITDLTEVRLPPPAAVCICVNSHEVTAALFWRGDLHLVERRRDLQKVAKKCVVLRS